MSNPMIYKKNIVVMTPLCGKVETKGELESFFLNYFWDKAGSINK